MVFFALTEFAFYSGNGYIPPPSVRMCASVFFLITSFCELMGVIVASVRSFGGLGFPRSHRQAHEEHVAAAALSGSTATHA